MNTATAAALHIDKEEYRNRKIVLELYHRVLFPYIANANERDVMEGLYKWLTNSESVLISKQQYEVYKQLEKLSLPELKVG